MKELSIEQKAKAYDEAIERAIAWRKKYVNSTISEDGTMIQDFDNIFPKLAVSEDEKIRKGIIKYLEQSQFGEEHYQIDDDIVRDYIAWLEKRDNIYSHVKLPTFTFDDVLALQCASKKVKEGKDLYEQLKSLHDRVYDAYWLEKQGEHTDIPTDAVLDSNKDGLIADTIMCKREKQDEQSPIVDKVEPKFKVGDVIRLKGSAAEYTIKKVTDTTYYTNGWSCGIERCEKDYELVKQKSSWSEEDNKIIEEIINDIECARAINYHAPKEGYEFRENWLKFLNERYAWKPSEEQMVALDGICSYIRNKADWEISQDMVSDLYKLSEQLKKLREE